MSESLKIGKKIVSLPQGSSLLMTKWKFEKKPGGWIVAESEDGVQGRRTRRTRMMISESQGRLSVSLRGYLWSGEWKSSHREIKEESTDGDLIAQFPGKVRKVLIEKGSQVLEGDSLVLVEAMKMEFCVRAPYTGKIKEIWVQEGQQLSPGDRFVELEAGESGSREN